ncbi:MAG: serine hydrolase domain-containing protein [Bacteroidota bacterium]
MLDRLARLPALYALLGVLACTWPVHLDNEDLGVRLSQRVDSLMVRAIGNRAFPGAAVAIGNADSLVLMQAYGQFTYEGAPAIATTSQFDMASLTKIIATTTVTMKLLEAGQLTLDDRVADYLPAFAQNGKGNVTLFHLLSHTAGLRPFRAFHAEGVLTRAAVIDTIMAEPLRTPPGAEARYSDFSMIALALVIEEITSQPFAEVAQQLVFEPLRMTSTGFRPNLADTRVVPTELDSAFRKRLIQGEVHDETAWLLGGTAGHAGLFSTVEDVARFTSMMVNDGRVGSTQFLQPETIRLFTTRLDATGEKHTRALGWDTRALIGERSSAGLFLGPNSYGHTGFTGTSMWIDPDANLYVIMLSNRVYPTRRNRRYMAVRSELADIAYRTLVDDDAAPVMRPEP